jgi:fluoroacetyl-CoA thioesterase
VTLEPGLTGEVVRRVDAAMLASAIGSGSIAVLSTPSLIALLESAACEAIASQLPEGQTTVGVHLDVRHLAATPPGLEVRARAELIEVDGRRLVFRVEAFDPLDKIGEGTHERALVDPQRLLARANAKRSSA